jgi:imidazoleglycerol-phosphate dehydratase/histidinol-phosphatase
LAEDIKNAGLQDTCVLITQSWDEIYAMVAAKNRRARVIRKTRETEIEVDLELDGKGIASITTGLGFFDHMLDQIARHSGCNLTIVARGDLHVDEHHTIEDTALALGEALLKALGDKTGIGRYGFMLPMDDCLAQAAIDFSGRSWLTWEVPFSREKIGDVPTEMFYHFFKSFTDAARCNLNIKAEGNNEHHKIEAVFKAFARAVKMAVQKDRYDDQLPSTKGVL